MKINLSIGGVGAFYETPQILETTSRALYSSRMINFQERKKKMVLKAPFFIRSLLASLNQVSFVFCFLKQNFQLEHLLQLRLIVLHFTSYTAVYFKCGSSFLSINAFSFSTFALF
jgi:hypothetical protein